MSFRICAKRCSRRADAARDNAARGRQYSGGAIAFEGKSLIVWKKGMRHVG